MEDETFTPNNNSFLPATRQTILQRCLSGQNGLQRRDCATQRNSKKRTFISYLEISKIPDIMKKFPKQ